MMHFSIHTTSRHPIPRWPYEKIAHSILGPHYELSLQFVGTTTARTLNQTYRKKSYAPDVLAFPLTDTIGQIIITPIVTTKKARAFNMTPRHYIGYLFIHACLHLRGYDHGARMDRAERKYCAQFAITHPQDCEVT